MGDIFPEQSLQIWNRVLSTWYRVEIWENYSKNGGITIGHTGSGSNYAKAYYLYGLEICDLIFDDIRKQVEKWDAIQWFQFIHSLSGGTGSGLGNLILEWIKENYSNELIQCISLAPSEKLSISPTDYYNTIMALNHSIECSNLTHIIDNEALYTLCSRLLRLSHPNISDFNELISSAVTRISSSCRFIPTQST